MKKEWEKQPWRLVPNKIVRYPGGREIDRFRGIAPAMDDGQPEAWVGSDTATFQADKTGDPYDGCAQCLSPDGEAMYLFEALQSNPEGLLGPEHTKQFGSKLGVLVKLLDAKEQLGLQCTPVGPTRKSISIAILERKKAGIFCLPEAIARNPRMYCWDSGRA